MWYDSFPYPGCPTEQVIDDSGRDCIEAYYADHFFLSTAVSVLEYIDVAPATPNTTKTKVEPGVIQHHGPRQGTVSNAKPN